MMQDQYHHNHTNHTTQLLLTPLLSFLIIQNILIWYWYEGKTALATWVNYNIYESKTLKPKSKFSSIWSQGIYLQMIRVMKNSPLTLWLSWWLTVETVQHIFPLLSPHFSVQVLHWLLEGSCTYSGAPAILHPFL